MKYGFTQLAVLGILAACAGNPAVAADIDPTTPEGFVKVQRKIQCSVQDEKPVIYTWFGRAWSRVPGERDRNVFNLNGFNIRQCSRIEDETRGTGYRLVSREIMLYLDPNTNEVLRTWQNPWTGQINEVIHVANDPVNSRPTFGRDKEGKPAVRPLKELNGTWFMNIEVPLFYTNPQTEAGQMS